MVVSALLAGQAAAAPASAPVGEGYGELLWMSIGLLAAIGVIAVVAVRLFGGGRTLRRGSGGGLLEVIARQPLEPRRSLYVVRVGERRLLVGTSELGVTMLTELEGGEAEERSEPQPAPSFAALVKDAARRWAAKRSAAADIVADAVAPAVAPATVAAARPAAPVVSVEERASERRDAANAEERLPS